MWPLLALIVLVAAVLVGCAVSLGGGTASVRNTRELEISPKIEAESVTTKEVKK